MLEVYQIYVYWFVFFATIRLLTQPIWKSLARQLFRLANTTDKRNEVLLNAQFKSYTQTMWVTVYLPKLLAPVVATILTLVIK